MLWGFADQRFSVGCVAGHFIRVWGGMLPNNPILWVRWYGVEEFFIWSQDKRHDFISRLLLRDWIGIIHPKLNTFVICHIIYLFEQRPNSCPKVPWNVAMRSTKIQSLHQLRSTGRMCGCTTVGQGHTLDSLGHSHPLAGQCPSMSKVLVVSRFRFLSRIFHWDHDHDEGSQKDFETTNLNTWPRQCISQWSDFAGIQEPPKTLADHLVNRKCLRFTKVSMEKNMFWLVFPPFFLIWNNLRPIQGSSCSELCSTPCWVGSSSFLCQAIHN